MALGTLSLYIYIYIHKWVCLRIGPSKLVVPFGFPLTPSPKRAPSQNIHTQKFRCSKGWFTYPILHTFALQEYLVVIKDPVILYRTPVKLSSSKPCDKETHQDLILPQLWLGALWLLASNIMDPQGGLWGLSLIKPLIRPY